MTKEFVRMGMDELSVSPASILPLRKKNPQSVIFTHTHISI